MLDGDLIRRLREDMGLTQQKLAERVEKSIVTISEIENGHRTNPTAETIKAIACALSVKPNSLMKW